MLACGAAKQHRLFSWLYSRSGHPDKQRLFFCFAGILASAVLAVNVVVSYQQKLTDFMLDLASESGQSAELVNKVE